MLYNILQKIPTLSSKEYEILKLHLEGSIDCLKLIKHARFEKSYTHLISKTNLTKSIEEEIINALMKTLTSTRANHSFYLNGYLQFLFEEQSFKELFNLRPVLKNANHHALETLSYYTFLLFERNTFVYHSIKERSISKVHNDFKTLLEHLTLTHELLELHDYYYLLLNYEEKSHTIDLEKILTLFECFSFERVKEHKENLLFYLSIKCQYALLKDDYNLYKSTLIEKKTLLEKFLYHFAPNYLKFIREYIHFFMLQDAIEVTDLKLILKNLNSIKRNLPYLADEVGLTLYLVDLHTFFTQLKCKGSYPVFLKKYSSKVDYLDFYFKQCYFITIGSLNMFKANNHQSTDYEPYFTLAQKIELRFLELIYYYETNDYDLLLYRAKALYQYVYKNEYKHYYTLLKELLNFMIRCGKDLKKTSKSIKKLALLFEQRPSYLQTVYIFNIKDWLTTEHSKLSL